MISSIGAISRFGDLAYTASNARDMGRFGENADTKTMSRIIAANSGFALIVTTAVCFISCPLTYFLSETALSDTIGPRDLLILYIGTAINAALGSLSVVWLATFDGLLISEKRTLISATSITLNITCVALFISSLGLYAVLIGQTVQFASALCYAFVLLRRSHKISFALPKLNLAHLRFAGPLQGTSILQQGFEYVTKIALLRIGGAEIVGLFEVALRGSQSLRQLIAGSLQVLLPHSARRIAEEPQNLSAQWLLVRTSTLVASLGSALACLALIFAIPLIADFFQVSSSGSFAFLMTACAIGWIGSLGIAPAFYCILGWGTSKPALYSSTIMLIVISIAALSISAPNWPTFISIYTIAIWLASSPVIMSLKQLGVGTKDILAMLRLIIMGLVALSSGLFARWLFPGLVNGGIIFSASFIVMVLMADFHAPSELKALAESFGFPGRFNRKK